MSTTINKVCYRYILTRWQFFKRFPTYYIYRLITLLEFDAIKILRHKDKDEKMRFIPQHYYLRKTSASVLILTEKTIKTQYNP